MNIYNTHSSKIYPLTNRKDIIMSDDYDGLLSAILMKKITNGKIKGYFSPNYFMTNGKIDISNTIGVDLTLYKSPIPCISNHVEKIHTIEDDYSYGISCNSHIVANENYLEKSLFSTTLFLWSAFAQKLPSSRLGKQLLLCVDATYKQYFIPKFKKHIESYLVAYGLHELLDVLKSTSFQEFRDIAKCFTIYEDIGFVIENGIGRLRKPKHLDEVLKELELDKWFDWDKDIPTFDKKMQLCIKDGLDSFLKDITDTNEIVFSFVVPFENTVRYSVVDTNKLIRGNK